MAGLGTREFATPLVPIQPAGPQAQQKLLSPRTERKEPWTDGVPPILKSELVYQPLDSMEPGSDGDFNIRTPIPP